MKKRIKQLKNGKNNKRFFLKTFLAVILLFIQFGVFAQFRTISGTVTTIDNNPLPGVTISVPGTVIGTITGIDGKFSLSVPQTAKTLVFSYVGMQTQEIEIDSRDLYNIIMAESVQQMDEVVVIGYGAQKKQSVVGSIVQTTNEKLQQTGNVTNLAMALTGQLPGLITLTATAEPGGGGARSREGAGFNTGSSGTNIFIRGRNTWNGGNPLILIDGIERDMFNIDIDEVENVSILKDASATAVFGVKGANGVILITTKRGSSGKTKLSFNYSTTGQFVSKLPPKTGSFEAQQARNEAILREVPLREASWDEYLPFEISRRYLPENQVGHSDWWWIYPDVDWEKAMFKDMGVTHRATLNINGGTDFVKYFGSVSYLDEGDMLRKYKPEEDYKPSYGFRRFNYRSNLDFLITKLTKLQINLSGYLSNKDTNMAYNQYVNANQSQMWASVYRMPPDIYLPRYPDGRWGSYPLISHGTLDNPVAFGQNMGENHYRNTQLNSDFALDQNLDFITKGLSARAQFYYDIVLGSRSYIYDYSNGMIIKSGQALNKYVDIWAYTGDPNQPESEYIFNYPTIPAGTSQFDWVNPIPSITNETILDQITQRRLQYQFQLNYAQSYNLHNVSALAALKRQEYAIGSMFKNYREDWVFRTTYDYNFIYLLELNGAYNGSEQFGPGYRFDFFPSLAIGYYISNEKFFPLDWMNRLKFRYSIGKVGDDTVIGGRWLYTDSYKYGGTARMNTQDQALSPYIQYAQSAIGNPDIHWEVALKNNYGLEMGLFNDLISINYDYFTENRTDILLAGESRSIPPYFGGSVPPANIGQVKSNGHEIELKFDKRTPKSFHYWGAIAITHTENEVIFKDDPILLEDYRKAAGHTINQRYTQLRANRNSNWDDIYASVPTETNDLYKQPGFWNIIDYNGDGMIKAEDSVPFGFSDIPQNTFNYTMGFDYKGFSAMIQFYGVTNVTRAQNLQNFSNRLNVWFVHMRDYWSKDNPEGTSFIPKWRTAGATLGDYWIWDGSYWRIKTAEIAYTIQSNISRKIGMDRLRIYLNGNNLFFWSRMLDDREGSFLGGSESAGTYPSVRRVNLGVNITF